MPSPVVDRRQIVQTRQSPGETHHQQQSHRPVPVEEVQNLDAAYRRTLGSSSEPMAVTQARQSKQTSLMRLAPQTPYWVADRLKKGA